MAVFYGQWFWSEKRRKKYDENYRETRKIFVRELYASVRLKVLINICIYIYLYIQKEAQIFNMNEIF